MFELVFSLVSIRASKAKKVDVIGLTMFCGHNLNKDHQRMMVDPMLMIVLDLR